MLSVFRNRNVINFIYKVTQNKIPLRNVNTLCKQLVYYKFNHRSQAFKTNLELKNYKHKKSKTEDLTETDEEQSNLEDDVVDKHTKVMTVKVNSLRADVILKSGLGIARNKIEEMFYESKIRVNGQKLLKKSTMLSVGDEVDIVKGVSVNNPDFLVVSRVEIISASERSEGLSVKLRRNKSLTIEKYDE